MVVYYLDNINQKMYISIEEAVFSLIYRYNLSIYEAATVIEDYILEASKEDADKAADIGVSLDTLKRGNMYPRRNVNQELKKATLKDKIQGNNTYVYNLGNSGTNTEKVYENDKKNFRDIDSAKYDKINNVKDKTRKEQVRDSTRSIAGTVPKHGADPEFSKDADKKAVAAYEKSTTKNQWKDYDIDKSVKDMDATKARIVKDRMERGEDLPESIKKSLVKARKGSSPGYRRIEDDKKGRPTVVKKLDNEEDRKEVYDIIKGIYQDKDPGKIELNRKKFLKHMGMEDYEGDIMFPKIDDKGNVSFRIEKGPKEERDNNSYTDHYHASTARGMKSLGSSQFSSAGVIYGGPKTFMADNPVTIDGKKMTDKNRGDLHRYKIPGKIEGSKIYRDKTIPDGSDNARYVQANSVRSVKPIPVIDIDKDKDNKKEKSNISKARDLATKQIKKSSKDASKKIKDVSGKVDNKAKKFFSKKHNQKASFA